LKDKLEPGETRAEHHCMCMRAESTWLQSPRGVFELEQEK